MADYIQTSTYEYILTYFTNNQITEPSIISSTVFDRAKSAQNTPSIYPIINDEGQNHLDYTYYTHIYNPETNTYSPLENPKKDVISCAYSFTNITKYYDENHNEFTSQSITKIDTNGTIHINDVGTSQIKTDFYENTYYYLDSTYYNLKVLYPTKLSLRYSDYFANDPTLIRETAHTDREDIIKNDNGDLIQIDQLIDCTEKFDSEHNVIQNNVFVRFPDRDFIDYKVDGINYNTSFSPNYIYEYKLSDNISSYSAEALNIFNELTGTLSLKSEYIKNNDYVDLTCRVLYEKDNFFSPYYFGHEAGNNNPTAQYTSSIIFRHYFKKYLPMKYELEDNTYVVYLNEAIEESLKNKQSDGLANKYGPTPVTMVLTGLGSSLSWSNISIMDNTTGQVQGYSLSGTTINFIGTFGHEYTFALKNTSYIVGNVYDGNSGDAAISNAKFKFIISRRSDRNKCIVVQNTSVGIQTPALGSIGSDQAFKQWIEQQTGNIGITGINIKIGSASLPSTDDNYVPPVITKKSITITFDSSTVTVNKGKYDIVRLNNYHIYVKNTTTPVSGLTLIWSIPESKSKIASIDGTTLNAKNLGTVTITARFDGNDSYYSAYENYTLKIEEGNDTTIETVDMSVKFARPSVSVEVNSGGKLDIQSVTISPSNWKARGYKIEYSTNDTSIATIIEDNGKKMLEIKKAGTVTITCTLKNSTGGYLASDRYTLKITIVPSAVRISFELTSQLRVPDGANYSADSPDAYFYPRVIRIIHKENSGEWYTTTDIKESTCSGNEYYDNRTRLKTNEHNITLIQYRYGGGNGSGYIPDMPWAIAKYFVEGNYSNLYFAVDGYVGPFNSRIVKSFGGEWGGVHYTEASQYQSKPEMRLDIVVFNHYPNSTEKVYEEKGYSYGIQNPFEIDNQLNIDILNQAYSKENNLISNDIIYGDGDDGNDNSSGDGDGGDDESTPINVNGTSITIEEYGLIQIEEMPELYLPKDLKNAQYNNLEYKSSNKEVAEIVYYDYEPEFGIETCLFNLTSDGKLLSNPEEDKLNVTNRLKPKLLIHKNGESEISVKYKGDDVYAETIDIKFKLVVKLKGNVKLSLDEDKFEIERQLASAIDELIDESSNEDNTDPILGFQTFQSPTPDVICEETIPIAFEYFSSNNVIGAPYGDLGNILIFDVGTIKVTIKLKETKKYHTAITSYQLTIKNPPDKTKTILNVEQAYYQIRYTQYVDKKIYRVYDAITPYKHLVFETNLYSEIAKIESNLREYSVNDNIKEYLIDYIEYFFYYKNSDTPCAVYDDNNNQIWSTNNYYNFNNIGQYKYLFDNLNGENIPLFDYENVEYYDNFSKAKVRLNCYDVLDEDGNHGYYIYSKGLTNRLKTDSNNFIKGSILGTYIDKHLKTILQKDSLGLADSTYPTYSENFSTYGMQIVNITNPKESKAFRHAFISDLEEYTNNDDPTNHVISSSVKGGCTFFVKQSKISKDDYDWKESLMFLKDYDDEELNHQIFKSKYTSNNTDEDVEYIFTSSVPEIAKTNSNGDVIIYSSGKVKIMIRSTETQNFTSGETGYVLDILPKELPMLEAKYNRYLYEMDTTLVENVFGCPDFDWNNSDPDAKLLFWIRGGGPSGNDDSYLTLDDIEGLKFDENNLEDQDWTDNGGDESEYTIKVSGKDITGEYTTPDYINLGTASGTFYEICKNESNITNIVISDSDHSIKLNNCVFEFYSAINSSVKITADNNPNLYNLFVEGYLKFSNNTNWLTKQFGTDYSIDIFENVLDENHIVNDSKYIKDVDGNFTIKIYLKSIPVFNSAGDNLGYFLDRKVTDSDGEDPRTYGDWYGTDPKYELYNDTPKYYRLYSDKYRKRYMPSSDGMVKYYNLGSQTIQELERIIPGFRINANEPAAYLSDAVEIGHLYISSGSSDDDEDYGSSNNVYAGDVNNEYSNEINTRKGGIVYGAGKSISKDSFQKELEITKNITYQKQVDNGDGTVSIIYTDKNGNPTDDPYTEKRKFKVSVDEAGNVTIENGLIGHVINVLVKSIETDNFKPTYLVYNIVIKSILDRGDGSDGTEQGNGFAVATTKKTNIVSLEENLIEVRTNPYASDASTNWKTISTPVFTCGSNDPDLTVEYYIYDGGIINSNEWYASHYFKEFRRTWLKPKEYDPAKNIIEIISGKTFKRTIDDTNEITTITVTDRYDKSIKFPDYENKELAKIDNNGNLQISSLLHDRVINVMIYFTATSDYNDNCVFYNVKVLKKNETILTLPQNIFNVSQPYPYSGILQFPEIKTNNTDTDEIRYYITARQVGKLLHDTPNFTEHLDSGDNPVTFNYGGDGGLYWETTYGHYADAFNTEKTNYNSSGVPKYEPTDILSDNYTYIINMNYPYPINNNGNTLFSIYKNGQIRYTNQAGRYVLNVGVISEETTNFLQGYGFYNLEVEIKDEPTLGVYPPYIEVKVGTKDVYVESPNIVCSNDDSNATLSFEIHEYVESGGSSVDPHYSAAVYQGNDITVDEVGNITIKGGLFNTYSSSTEKKWWIKVTSNPSPNFGAVWTKFVVCAVPKKLQSISYCPSTILLRPSTIDRTIKSDIKFSNTDEDCILTYTSSNPSNVSIDSFGVMTVYANTTGNTNITITSPETENFRASETTYQFLVSVAEKITPTLTINGGSSSMNLTRTVVTGSEVFAGPTIEHNNTDKEVKIVYISNDTSIMTVTPKGALMVYKTGNVTLTIKVKETENYKEATGTVSINISQQSIPSDVVYGAYSPYTDPGTDPGTGGTTPSSGGTNKIGGMNHLNIYQAGGNSTGSDGTGVEDDTPILYTSAGGLIASDGPYEDLTNYSSSTYNSSSNLCSASGSGNEYIQIGVSNVPSNYGTPTVYKVGVVQNDSGDNNVNISGTLYSPVNKSDITIEGSNGNYIIKAKILPNSHNGYRRVHVYLAYPYAGSNDSNWPSDIHPGVSQYNGIYLNGIYAGSGGSGSGNNVFYVNLGGNAQGYCGDGVIYDFFLQNTINDIPKEQGGDYYRQPVIKVTNNDKAVTLSNLTITDGYGAVLYAYSSAVNTYTFSINANTSNNIYFNCPHINAGDNTGKFINFTLSNGVNTVRCHIRIIREDAL